MDNQVSSSLINDFLADSRLAMRIRNGEIADSESRVDSRFLAEMKALELPTIKESEHGHVQAKSHWYPLHEYQWTSEQSARAFFADWWKQRPQCNCSDSEKILEANPISFESDQAFFESGVRLHNAVSSKPDLSKTHPRFTIQQAMQKWRPNLWPVQPKLDLLAVTSLSPLEVHQEVQRVAIESWRRFGLDIVSVNLEQEIESLKRNYQDLEFRLGEATTAFNRPVPTINSLLDQGRDRPILVINSDCALYGPQSLIDVEKPSVIIRYNWESHFHDARREQWGLDSFLLTPELTATVPRLPFGIGKPMWDYWLPWHLEQQAELTWIGEPLIYHKLHPLNWNTSECNLGRQWIRDHYGDDVGWIEWRESRPYTYSEFTS